MIGQTSWGQTAGERYLDYWQKIPRIAKRLTAVQVIAHFGVSHKSVNKIRRKMMIK